MKDTLDKVVQTAIANELKLLTPAVRRSRLELEQLLHPEYFEFGASGRHWDRKTTLATLPTSSTSDQATITALTIRGQRLADDVVLLTYLSEQGGLRALRSSIWRKVADSWLLYFHQGTPVTQQD